MNNSNDIKFMQIAIEQAKKGRFNTHPNPLVGAVIVKNDKMWFDTNLTKHHHFYDEEEDELVDIQEKEINFSKFPKAPHGKSIKSVDIIINTYCKCLFSIQIS